jgi:hypothetical protein
MRSVGRAFVSMYDSTGAVAEILAYLPEQPSSTCHPSSVSIPDVQVNTFNLPMRDKYASPPLVQ